MKTKLIFLLLITATCLKAQDFKNIESLIAAERFDVALDSLQLLKQKNPHNPYVYFGLGETVLKSYISDPYSDTKSNVVKEAKTYFNEGVKVDSLNPLNYVGLGIIELFQKENTSEADRYFSKAESFIPEKKKHITELHIKTLVKLATAELYSQNPRIDKAKGYITRLMSIAPKKAEVYIANGDLLIYKTSNASDAIASYEKALSLENEPLTNVLIGKIYIGAKIFDDAQKHLEQAVKEDSLFAPAYKGLGDLYYAKNQNQKAKGYYAKFLRLTGNNIPAKISYTKSLFMAKDYEGALKSAEEIVKIDSSKAYLYRIAGYSAFRMEPPLLEKADYNMAQLFKKANSNELITMDYLNYGRILLELNKDSASNYKGISMLEKVYQADTSDRSLITEIFKDAYRAKIFPVAINYMNLLIKLGANTQNNYLFLGRIYYQMRDFKQADSTFKIAISLDSTNIDAYKWRGYAVSSLDPDMKTGQARPIFEKIIELGSSDVTKYKKELIDAYNYLGSFYLLSDKPDFNKSGQYFEKLIDLKPDNQDVLLKGYQTLAYISTKSKEYEKARSYYEKILAVQPNDQVSIRGLRYLDKQLKAAK